MRLPYLLCFLGACSGGSSPGDQADANGSGSDVDAFDGPTGTRTYRQGVGGYSGTKSAGISTYSGLGNPGDYNANGMTFADGQNDWCTGIDIPAGNYSEVWLLRFDELGIPAGATVVSASLSIHGHGDSTTGLYFAGSYLAKDWYGDTPTSCAGCSNSPVGWRWANGDANPWSALGASGTADTIANKTFRLPETGDVASDYVHTELTTPLDPSVVQGWIDGTNHGLRIVAGVAGHHMGFVQPQRDTSGSTPRPLDMRPQLTIVLAE